MRSTLLLLPFFLLACGDGKADAARELAEMDAHASEAQASLDLQAFDLPLIVTLPGAEAPEWDTLYGKPQWLEEFGHMRINAGEHFGITITEDLGDLSRLKADLERDMLCTNTVLEETETELVYRKQFPDADLVFFHFYRVVQVGDRSFIVESAMDGRFAEADIDAMRSAVQPATAL